MPKFTGYHLVPASAWVKLPKEKQELLRNCGGFPVNDAFIRIWERPATTRRELLILYGTYGSSKTHDRILELLLLSMTEKYFKCFYGRAVFDLAKTEFHSSFISVIKREGWEDKFEFSTKPNGTKEISCKATGNKFKPFGCDDEDSIGKGWDDATHVFVDEVNQIEFKQFGMLQSRARMKGVRKAFIGCFNNCDVYDDHWIRTNLLNKDVALEDDKGKPIERNIIEHFSLYTDNFFIDQDEYKAQLIEQAGNDLERRNAYLTGAWGVKTNGMPFYKDFSQKLHVAYCEYDPALCLHISWDENVNPYLPVSIWQIKGLNAYCIDEIAAENPFNKLRWVCNEIEKRYGEYGKGHKSGMIIYGDATSRKEDVKAEKGKDFFILAKEYLEHFRPKLRVSRSNPNLKMRGDFINDVLGRNIFGLFITISPLCKHMVADLLNTAEDPDGVHKDKTKTKVNGISGVQKWGHFCFAGDTSITTIHGNKRIDNIEVGDLVLTRSGYKKVLNVWDNGIKETFTYKIGDTKLQSTPNHKIWTESGFQPIGHLFGKIIFCIFDKNIGICKQTLPITMEGCSPATLKGKQDQINPTIPGGFIMTAKKQKSDCIDTNGYAKGEKYPKGIISTILTEIRSIMTLKILHALLRKNTYPITTKGILKNIKSILKIFWLQKPKMQQKNGISQMKERLGIAQTQSIKPIGWQEKKCVRNAELSISREVPDNLNFAPIGAEKGLPQGHSGRKEKVYDIEVEDVHEYFANGILVSNSDTLDYFICEAFMRYYLMFQKGGKSPKMHFEPRQAHNYF